MSAREDSRASFADTHAPALARRKRLYKDMMSVIERNLNKQPDIVKRTVTEAELTAKLASEPAVAVDTLPAKSNGMHFTPRKRHTLAAPMGSCLHGSSARLPIPALGSQNLTADVNPQLKVGNAYPGSPQVRYAAVSTCIMSLKDTVASPMIAFAWMSTAMPRHCTSLRADITLRHQKLDYAGCDIFLQDLAALTWPHWLASHHSALRQEPRSHSHSTSFQCTIQLLAHLKQDSRVVCDSYLWRTMLTRQLLPARSTCCSTQFLPHQWTVRSQQLPMHC